MSEEHGDMERLTEEEAQRIVDAVRSRQSLYQCKDCGMTWHMRLRETDKSGRVINWGTMLRCPSCGSASLIVND